MTPKGPLRQEKKNCCWSNPPNSKIWPDPKIFFFNKTKKMVREKIRKKKEKGEIITSFCKIRCRILLIFFKTKITSKMVGSQMQNAV